MLTRIYHKKNELFQVEFYQDKECQQAFNFENIKNLYIELKDGDCTPIFSLSNKLWSLNIKTNIFTPTWYLGLYDGISPQTPLITLNDVLDDIDLSKYIPTDNAVLFLSEEEANKHSDNCESWFLYQKDFPVRQFKSEMDIRDWKAITIFFHHGTQSELLKKEKVAKELKEKYGVREVNLLMKDCFVENLKFIKSVCGSSIDISFTTQQPNTKYQTTHRIDNGLFCNQYIDKIITTNSTGILEPQDEKRLQILDCYDIFNDYLKGE